MITLFENFNENKYVITTALFNELHVIDKNYEQWKSMSKIDFNNIKLFTYEDAEKKI